MPYNEERVETTWETSTIRKWLNEDFINTAFTEGEQTVLINSDLPAEDNVHYGTAYGNATQDRVFYLSVQDVLTYLPEYESRLCASTPYAVGKGMEPDEKGNVGWTLRTPGGDPSVVCAIARNAGYIFGIGDYEVSLKSAQGGVYVDGTGLGVRPALWLSRQYADEDLEVDEEQFIPESEAVYEDPTVYTDEETVKAAQTALNEAGFDCGTPDGKAGDMTRNAVTKYQEANGLQITGNVDGTLLHSLGLL